MSRDWSYRVWDKQEKTYSDKAFSIDQYGIPYVQDEDGYWEEASDRYVFEFSTGLEDMNGKMIREGDIVKVYAWTNLIREMDYRHTTEVFWQERYAQFNTTYNDVLSNEIAQDYFEVIGNIHENPELLGDEE